MAIQAPSVGSFTKRVKIFDVSESDDGQGGAEEVTSERTTTWAFVEQLTGKRALQYGGISSSKMYRMVIHKKNITEKNLIGYGSLTLTIHSLSADNWYNEIICVAR
jgi:SPP1 family predicted phage head-tail adaptor